MKITIKNLTNSPYRIGTHTLPARGGLRGVEVTVAEVAQYRALGYFEIREEPQLAHQQEHGKEDALRAAYEAASGKQADKRWSEKRLQEEIAKLKD